MVRGIDLYIYIHGPAPTRMCISSMKRMACPCRDSTSRSTVLGVYECGCVVEWMGPWATRSL